MQILYLHIYIPTLYMYVVNSFFVLCSKPMIKQLHHFMILIYYCNYYASSYVHIRMSTQNVK